MKCTIKTIAIIMALFIATSLWAVPNTINFQGALKDADGVPVNDTQFMEFRIYDNATAGSLLWSEQHLTVEIADGIFSEELGNTTAFPVGMFDNPELYITFFFGGEEMTPRQKLLSVPYSIQSDEATNADTASYASTIEGVALSGLVQQDVSGNATITGTMTANAFVGDGSGLTNISGSYDSIYVNTTGPDTMTANTLLGVLNIENTFISGKGLKIIEAGDGVYIDSVRYDGVEIAYAGDHGIEIIEVLNDGVNISSAGDNGVHISSAGDVGVFVFSAGDEGVYVGSTGDAGVRVSSAGSDGVVVNEAVDNLFQGGSDGNEVFAVSNNGTVTATAFVGDGSGLTGIAGFNDSLYIHATGPDTMTANTLGGVLNIENTHSSGHGINILDAGYYGVYVESAYGGVYVESANRGVYVDNVGTDGVSVWNAGEDGVHVDYAGDSGVHVSYAGDDGFYVYNAGDPLTENISSSKNGFEVAGAEGKGLYVGHADEDGVYVSSAGGDGVYVGFADGDGFGVFSADDDGVSVMRAGNPSTYQSSTSKNGFEVAGASGHGLYVGQADANGVYINNADTTGVYVNSAGEDGVVVYNAGDDGVYVYNAGDPSWQFTSSLKNGFEVAGAQGYGLYVGHANYDGVYVYSAGGDGVYANTTNTENEYGIYTPDKMYAGAGYSSFKGSTFGKNTGSGTLEPGDLVCISGGYEENVLGEDGVPVINIAKANSRNSEAIFGVVEYKVYIREEIEEFEEGRTEIQKSFRHADGNVMSGDYLAIIVFGPVDVKVDSRADINIGEKMTVSDNGDARSINDDDNWRIGILGKALEDSDGSDMLKVFVNCK